MGERLGADVDTFVANGDRPVHDLSRLKIVRLGAKGIDRQADAAIDKAQ
jgi:hypothetical protein